MTISDFECIDENGISIPNDAFGNNTAFRCPNCGYPVLAALVKKITNFQRGLTGEKPSICRSCKQQYWLEITDNKLVLRRIEPK